MVGITSGFFILLGERFRVGVYLWLGMLFSIIFALRMGEVMFYMAEAGVIAVLVYRIFFPGEDVRDEE